MIATVSYYDDTSCMGGNYTYTTSKCIRSTDRTCEYLVQVKNLLWSPAKILLIRKRMKKNRKAKKVFTYYGPQSADLQISKFREGEESRIDTFYVVGQELLLKKKIKLVHGFIT